MTSVEECEHDYSARISSSRASPPSMVYYIGVRLHAVVLACAFALVLTGLLQQFEALQHRQGRAGLHHSGFDRSV